METNVLYYGDNLTILRDHIANDSVDLVYLDPPFNSKRDYNVIFKDESGNKSDAQLLAFEDTWHWGPSVESAYQYLTNFARHQGKVPTEVSALVGALRKAIGTNQMMAYLVEMTVRLVELHRVLKATGSLYLHCDPTASAYLKVVLDAIFGPKNFRSDITWRRTNVHNDSKDWSAVADTILYYVRDAESAYTWNPVRLPLSEKHRDSKYRMVDPDGRPFTLSDMTSPNPRPNMMYEWRGHASPPLGWRYEKATMAKLDAEGRIWYPDDKSKRPRLKRYLDAALGSPVTNIWTDIDPINSQARERLGYPTQKPIALLERIIAASSNPGDVVLDPFCGCGTALIAAQELGRRWVGIDVTYLSIAVMESRLVGSFPDLGHVKVIGQPTEVEGARMLAEQSLDGRYEFQYWALTRVGAQPVQDKKKGADAGIDGRIAFTEAGNDVRFVLVSVKSGGVNVSQLRDLIGTMQREDAPLGLFVTLEEPSKPMMVEASGAGTYWSELANREYPKVQILTVRDLLEGKRPQLPLLVLPTYQLADKVQVAPGQVELFGT